MRKGEVMKSLFIFGAGASRAAGGPLMSDFFDKAERLVRRNQVQDARGQFENVLNVLADLQRLHSKSYFDIDNLEMVFGAIEMGQMIEKFADRSPQEMAQLHEDMVVLIYKTLEKTILFPVSGKKVIPPEGYRDFVAMLNEVTAKTHRSDYAFITFNYDLALDYALFFNNHSMDYFLDNSVARSSGVFPLLKLHGSINWGYCSQCNEIVPYHLKELPPGRLYFDKPKMISLELGSMLDEVRHAKCNGNLAGPPVIVPPTWNKSGHHSRLVNVWRRAAKELETAENIFIIGYSLPESDLFFRYLMSLGLEGPTRIKRLWVINPDQSEVEPRFQRLIGHGLENRFQFLRENFLSSIGWMKGALEDI